jgi:hypothetical protein
MEYKYKDVWIGEVPKKNAEEVKVESVNKKA